MVPWQSVPPPPPSLGPRPQRPTPPEMVQTSHVLHLILTVITFGMWAILWIIVAILNEQNNSAKRKRYNEQMVWYQGAYDDWQQRHYAVYGRYAPDIPSY
jgi:hypothetical protein